MREELGFEVIKKPIPYLSLCHEEHISGHGEGNERKLTGKHETAKINPVSLAVANCGCSIYEDCDTKRPGKGYLKDGVLPQTWASMLCLITARDYNFMGSRPKVEALSAKKLALKV